MAPHKPAVISPISDYSDNARAFGAGVLVKLIQTIDSETTGARLGNDIEHIHRLRVASRRLRNALSLFEKCFSGHKLPNFLKQVKILTVALGDARDLDVQIATLQSALQDAPDKKFHPGLRRLILRLSQRRRKQQKNVQQTLDEYEKKGRASNVLAAMTSWLDCAPGDSAFPADLYRLASESIQLRLQSMLAYDEVIYNPENIEELHATRKAAKWLRYTLEVFAPLYDDKLHIFIQDTRQIQDMLGSLHDCDVWMEYLQKFEVNERQRIIDFYGHSRPYSLLKPGIAFFMQNHQLERQRLFQRFLARWTALKDEALWDYLLTGIGADKKF